MNPCFPSARLQRVPSTLRITSLLLAFAAAACGSDSEPENTINPGITGDSGVDSSVPPQPEAGAADSSVPAADTGVLVPVADAGMDAGAGFDSGLSDTGVAGDAAGGDAGEGGAVGGEGGVGIGLEGTGLSVFPTNGQPLDTPNGAWKYHEFPDTSCRNGSKAGITVYRNTASKKVMFFFEGGGACFNRETCAGLFDLFPINPATVDDADRAGKSGGILDRNNPANPVKDWNFVYVPYCTGDTFGGTNANGMVPDVGPQKFVGFLNTQAFLQRVVPTFADATDVLVTGVSAGGFGASMSVLLIQRAFPNVKVKLINDSGPPMPASAVPTCLQKMWRERWGFDESILKDCGASCPNKDDFTMDYGLFLGKTFGNRFSGLIETTGDGIISAFFGIGSNNCTGSLLGPAVPQATFQAGLLEFREKVKQYTSFGTFFPTGTEHTWLMGASFYTKTVGGVKMVDWVSDIINEKGTKHVGP